MVQFYGDNQLEHWRIGLDTQHPYKPHTPCNGYISV